MSTELSSCKNKKKKFKNTIFDSYHSKMSKNATDIIEKIQDLTPEKVREIINKIRGKMIELTPEGLGILIALTTIATTSFFGVYWLERFFIYTTSQIFRLKVRNWFLWGRRPQKTSQQLIFPSDQPGKFFRRVWLGDLK